MNVSGVDYKKGEAGIILSEMILGGRMLEGKYVGRIFTGIKDTLNITYGSSDSGLIQDYACAFNDGNSFTFTDRTLSPAKKSIMETMCLDEIEQMWQAEEMPEGMQNSNMPNTLENWVAFHVAKKASRAIDREIFLGSGGTQATGFITRALADSSAVKVTGVTITKANILTALTTVYNALTENAFEFGDVKIFLSKTNYGLYKQAVSELGLYNGAIKLDGVKVSMPLWFDEEVEVVYIPNLLNTRIFASSASNLFLGTDLTSDANSVIVSNQYQAGGTLDRSVRIRMDYKIDANYADSAVVVVGSF
jgi:hypothetical protein